MTLADLYPDVRFYSEVETMIMTGGGGEMGGGSGRTYGKGRRGRRWQGMMKGAQERGTGRGVRELSSEVGREGNVWGAEMAPPLQSCAQCVLLTASEH